MTVAISLLGHSKFRTINMKDCSAVAVETTRLVLCTQTCDLAENVNIVTVVQVRGLCSMPSVRPCNTQYRRRERKMMQSYKSSLNMFQSIVHPWECAGGRV